MCEIWFYTPALLFTFVNAHYKLNMLCTDQNRRLKSRIRAPTQKSHFFWLKMEHSIVEYSDVWQSVDTKQVVRSTITVHKQLFLPGTVCC